MIKINFIKILIFATIFSQIEFYSFAQNIDSVVQKANTVNFNNSSKRFYNKIEHKNMYVDENYFYNAYSKYKKTMLPNNPKYSKMINSIIDCYNRNNFSGMEAEPYIVENLRIKKCVFGEQTPMYCDALISVAEYYKAHYNYSKAELHYLLAYSKVKNYSDSGVIYSKLLNKISKFYYNQGNFAEGKKYILEFVEIQKKIFESDIYRHYEAIENVANLCREYKDYKTAESFYIDALEYQKNVLGDSHPDYLISLIRLGYFYKETGEKLKEEKIFLQVFTTRKNICKGRVELLESALFLADFYAENGNSIKAVKYFNYACEHVYESIVNRQKVMSEKEWLSFLSYNFLWHAIQSYKIFLYTNPAINDSFNINVYNTELLLKNGYLRAFLKVKNDIKSSNSSDLIECYNTYIAFKKSSFSYEITQSITKKIDSLEKELTLKSAAFSNQQMTLAISYNDIKNRLKIGETCIEDINLRKNLWQNGWHDSIFNVALIARNDFIFPVVLPLFEQRQIDSYIQSQSHYSASAFYSSVYNSKDLGLYNLVVKPMEKVIKGVSTIYFAPSGALNELNLSAIPIDSTTTFGEKYNIHILGTTADVINYKPTYLTPKSIQSAIVYGGIDYDKSKNYPIKPNENKDPIGFEQVAELASRGGGAVGKFGYLKGTEEETKNIENLCNKNNIKAITITSENATETSFKQLNGKKESFILHIATHGYFFPDPEMKKQIDPMQQFMEPERKNVFKWSDDPLLRSGLIFAGANKAWGNPDYISNDSTEDGILTSYEISNLDLSNCQLVVLSACETGLGDIKGSEGVFGLQRAFKMAGVKNIIMSLWKVPDAQTSELMTLFYNNCFAGKSVHDALQAAQTDMRRKGYAPYYWAAFKLLE